MIPMCIKPLKEPVTQCKRIPIKLDKYIDSVLVISQLRKNRMVTFTPHVRKIPNTHNEWAEANDGEKVEDLSHEFYNLGHMVEGAIAHYQVTGNAISRDIAIKYADCVCREIGDKPGQTVAVPGHQIAEMALAKLYLVNGDKKYLNQAKFFLIKEDIPPAPTNTVRLTNRLFSKTRPGHAVRAAYMYSAWQM